MLIHPLTLLDSKDLFSVCWERSSLPGILNVSLPVFCSVDLGGGKSSGSGLALSLGRWITRACAFVCFHVQELLQVHKMRDKKLLHFFFPKRLNHLFVDYLVSLYLCQTPGRKSEPCCKMWVF